jgi:hypothetical protein
MLHNQQIESQKIHSGEFINDFYKFQIVINSLQWDKK